MLPRRGKKDSMLSPTPLTPSQKRRLEERESSLKKAVMAPRVTREKYLARADWDRAKHQAVVTAARGSMMQSMGYFHQGKQYLHPEEAMFLVDRGNMDLCVNGLPASVQRAWSMAMSAPNSVSLNEYLAFAHLRRAGYVVRRYDENENGTESGLHISFSVWRAGSFKRKGECRPLFHLAVFGFDEAPPPMSAISKVLERSDKTRLRFALIDRGVVVLTDISSNATPLSERYIRRLPEEEQDLAKSLEKGLCDALFGGNGDAIEDNLESKP